MKLSLSFLIILFLCSCSQINKSNLSLKDYKIDRSPLNIKVKIVDKLQSSFSLEIKILNTTKRDLYINIPSNFFWGKFLVIRNSKTKNIIKKNIKLHAKKSLPSNIQSKTKNFRLIKLNLQKHITIKLPISLKKNSKTTILNTGLNDFILPQNKTIYSIQVIFFSSFNPLQYADKIPKNVYIWQGLIRSKNVLLKL